MSGIGKSIQSLLKQINSPANKGLAKQIWADVKPPQLNTFGKFQKECLQTVQSFQRMEFLNWTVNDAIRKGLVGVQVYCFFKLGEIIGRRNLMGYKNHVAHH